MRGPHGGGARPVGLLLPPARCSPGRGSRRAPTATAGASGHPRRRATYRSSQEEEAHLMGVTAAADERRTEGSRACGGEGVRSSVKWGYVEERRGPGHGEARRSMGDAVVVEEQRGELGSTGIGRDPRRRLWRWGGGQRGAPGRMSAWGGVEEGGGAADELGRGADGQF